MLQFVCDVVKDTGKEEYLRPFIHIGFIWMKLLEEHHTNAPEDAIMAIAVTTQRQQHYYDAILMTISFTT